ncbi:stage II sporulation protein M [Candidatus Woesearchaeota archaeon]|nr:stage II sporulation protein M [Candidatus Woesearchaeota archaeon]MBW3022256.1 stage II sporulation protein M [Candidatus Woesearchaeota archaeon]
MVLEQLYPISWIEKRKGYAFLMGISYSILGIFSGMVIFPDNPGLVSIAFTSLLLLPSLNRLLALEENVEARKRFWSLQFFREHWDVVKIYLFLWLGIMLTYAFFTLVLPQMSSSLIFAQQARVVGAGIGITGFGASFSKVFFNNLWVLLIVLIASFIYGAGSIFVITWNASVWGVVFGLIAQNSGQQNPYIYFILTFIAVLPHLVAEASSYLLAAVSGGVISKAVIREKFMSSRFKKIVTDGFLIFGIGVLVLVIGAYIEASASGTIISFFGL